MAESGGFWDSVSGIMGDVFGTSGKDGKNGWINDVGDFLESNKGLVEVGAGIYDVFNSNKQNEKIRDIYAQSEQQNYDNSKANYDAYQAWAQGEMARRSGDAAARAAAARANDARRLEAAGKAQEQMDKTRKKAMGFLRPYIRANKQLLPGQLEQRLAGQQISEALGQKIQNQQPVRAQDILMPIPDYMGRQ